MGSIYPTATRESCRVWRHFSPKSGMVNATMLRSPGSAGTVRQTPFVVLTTSNSGRGNLLNPMLLFDSSFNWAAIHGNDGKYSAMGAYRCKVAMETSSCISPCTLVSHDTTVNIPSNDFSWGCV